eukprot:UC1_evm2s1068
MPHKVYHGKTGIVYNVTPHALGVVVNKRIKNRILAKKINIRVEHLKHSKCRTDFLRRVDENAAAKKAGKKSWELKRLPQAPKDAEVVNFSENKPVEVHALKFEFLA